MARAKSKKKCTRRIVKLKMRDLTVNVSLLNDSDLVERARENNVWNWFSMFLVQFCEVNFPFTYNCVISFHSSGPLWETTREPQRWPADGWATTKLAVSLFPILIIISSSIKVLIMWYHFYLKVRSSCVDVHRDDHRAGDDHPAGIGTVPGNGLRNWLI